jgi:hypothetical protein
VTERPRLLSNFATEAVVMPFPTELTTPPVMKMNFGIYPMNRLDPRRQAVAEADHLFGTHRMSGAKRVSTTLDGNRGYVGRQCVGLCGGSPKTLPRG